MTLVQYRDALNDISRFIQAIFRVDPTVNILAPTSFDSDTKYPAGGLLKSDATFEGIKLKLSFDRVTKIVEIGTVPVFTFGFGVYIMRYRWLARFYDQANFLVGGGLPI